MDIFEPQSETISNSFLESFIRETAHNIGRIRKLKNLLREQEHLLFHLNDIVSSNQDMINDWKAACAFIVSEILHGKSIEFLKISPNSYPILEGVWLTEIKELNAYFIWEEKKTYSYGDHKKENADQNYFMACEKIRNLLFYKANYPPEYFENIFNYIEKRYLVNGKVDASNSYGSETLIRNKAQRIYHTTGNTNQEENWFRAQLYVKMYYENIIPAVIDGDVCSMSQVLKAFEFSKVPENRYLIINSFETAIVIYFFDKVKLKQLLENPKQYNFNMIPMYNWPEDFDFYSKDIKYDKKENLLIYNGVMGGEEMEMLISKLKDYNHKMGIEMLFYQSHLKPYEAMVL